MVQPEGLTKENKREIMRNGNVEEEERDIEMMEIAVAKLCIGKSRKDARATKAKFGKNRQAMVKGLKVLVLVTKSNGL